MLGVGLAGAAQAASVTFNGILDTSDPTMRVVSISTPLCVSQRPAPLVHYDTVRFTVDASGVYQFSQLSPVGRASLYLYQDSFDPTDALTNCTFADNTGDPVSFDAFLTVGTNYIAVPFDDNFSQTGATYALTITGPGDIIVAAVPEPGSMVLLAGALLPLVGVGRFRRRVAR